MPLIALINNSINNNINCLQWTIMGIVFPSVPGGIYWGWLLPRGVGKEDRDLKAIRLWDHSLSLISMALFESHWKYVFVLNHLYFLLSWEKSFDVQTFKGKKLSDRWKSKKIIRERRIVVPWNQKYMGNVFSRMREKVHLLLVPPGILSASIGKGGHLSEHLNQQAECIMDYLRGWITSDMWPYYFCWLARLTKSIRA
jgi:hypothetical protein